MRVLEAKKAAFKAKLIYFAQDMTFLSEICISFGKATHGLTEYLLRMTATLQRFTIAEPQESRDELSAFWLHNIAWLERIAEWQL